MPKFYEAPTLRRFGVVGDLTASDFKCTPGGDGGFTYWDHSPVAGVNYKAIALDDNGEPYHVPGSDIPLQELPGTCRGVTTAEKLRYDITPNP